MVAEECGTKAAAVGEKRSVGEVAEDNKKTEVVEEAVEDKKNPEAVVNHSHIPNGRRWVRENGVLVEEMEAVHEELHPDKRSIPLRV